MNSTRRPDSPGDRRGFLSRVRHVPVLMHSSRTPGRSTPSVVPPPHPALRPLAVLATRCLHVEAPWLGPERLPEGRVGRGRRRLQKEDAHQPRWISGSRAVAGCRQAAPFLSAFPRGPRPQPGSPVMRPPNYCWDGMGSPAPRCPSGTRGFRGFPGAGSISETTESLLPPRSFHVWGVGGHLPVPSSKWNCFGDTVTNEWRLNTFGGGGYGTVIDGGCGPAAPPPAGPLI